MKGHNIFPFALITPKATRISTTGRGEPLPCRYIEHLGKMNTTTSCFIAENVLDIAGDNHLTDGENFQRFRTAICVVQNPPFYAYTWQIQPLLQLNKRKQDSLSIVMDSFKMFSKQEKALQYLSDLSGITWQTSVAECTAKWCFNWTHHENLTSPAYIQIKIHPGFKGNWRCRLLGLRVCWELLCINLSEDLICIQIRLEASGTLAWNCCICDL